MRKISNILEIRKLELEILLKIDDICRKNNLRYSLARGTLLGAIKYKGFIPWDDDIDIMMPRPDYDKFLNLCMNIPNDVFELFSHRTKKNYGYLFNKACHKKTKLIEYDDKYERCELGVYVDIFPVDGLGNDIEIARKMLSKVEWDKVLLMYSYTKNIFQYMKERNSAKTLYPVKYILFRFSKLLNKNKIEKKMENRYTKYLFSSSEYCACISRNSSTVEIIETSFFNNLINVEFEGHIFKAINKPDIYLSNLYGDINLDPPKDKQVPHHEFVAYYLE